MIEFGVGFILGMVVVVATWNAIDMYWRVK